MQLFLEYFPLIVFFIVNSVAGIYWATGSLIIAACIQMLHYKFKKEKIPTKQWIIFGLVVVFGGLTIYLQNDAFLKWKVTIINAFFAGALLVSDLLFKRNIIKQFLGESLALPEKIWTRLNLAWAMFFLFCAGLNYYVAFNFDLDTWVNFKVFGLTGLMFIFSITSILFLYKYLPLEEDDNDKVKDEKSSKSN
ncbi:septation protein A [Colwellia sp. MT41]|uniref:Inner membrane-spanning protein YciB n=1 Tax=Colwellia marinimaniae TaxID=1513592 RepID=A0ABQ0MSD5_9GAMM|nr:MULTISPECIES: septation protein A [Colwellia]ALO34960.1 septation protein A [Colwellia sp. MT41]GAW95284.1 putative intracellular septation protein A [Colwellia marinimaniae]